MGGEGVAGGGGRALILAREDQGKPRRAFIFIIITLLFKHICIHVCAKSYMSSSGRP